MQCSCHLSLQTDNVSQKKKNNVHGSYKKNNVHGAEHVSFATVSRTANNGGAAATAPTFPLNY